MSEKSNPQYARVEQPFGCDFPTVHCPICGKATTEVYESDSEAGYEPCSHLAFIYVGAVGDFAHKSDDFARRTDDLYDDTPGSDSIEALLKQAEYDNKFLAIELTHGGMACGPVWHTDVFGFDYGSLAD